MDKIVGSIETAYSLQATEKAPQYDAASKELLANKELLAIILKYTVKEYADMTFQGIADCIEGDSITRVGSVAPGKEGGGRIEGVNAEFNVLGEVVSFFDLLFKAVNPKLSNEKVTCHLHIDFESQGDYHAGYPLEKRGIFYMSRMISSQVPVPTGKTNYGGLEKVYSIWVCRERVPKRLQNTMSVYGVANLWNSRDIELNEGDYDLMALVVLRLGNPQEECREDIFRILNALFYPRSKKAYEVLDEYIDFSETLKMEVKKMVGLGESILREGFEQGIEQGIGQIVLYMLKKGNSISEIVEYTGITAEEVERIVNSQGVLV
jgi:hypothetical protein